jgi:hypothetical protein
MKRDPLSLKLSTITQTLSRQSFQIESKIHEEMISLDHRAVGCIQRILGM